jgi:hypothetical protein
VTGFPGFLFFTEQFEGQVTERLSLCCPRRVGLEERMVRVYPYEELQRAGMEEESHKKCRNQRESLLEINGFTGRDILVAGSQTDADFCSSEEDVQEFLQVTEEQAADAEGDPEIISFFYGIYAQDCIANFRVVDTDGTDADDIPFPLV